MRTASSVAATRDVSRPSAVRLVGWDPESRAGWWPGRCRGGRRWRCSGGRQRPTGRTGRTGPGYRRRWRASSRMRAWRMRWIWPLPVINQPRQEQASSAGPGGRHHRSPAELRVLRVALSRSLIPRAPKSGLPIWRTMWPRGNTSKPDVDLVALLGCLGTRSQFAVAATGLTMPGRAGRRIRRTGAADVSGTEPQSAPGTTRTKTTRA